MTETTEIAVEEKSAPSAKREMIATVSAVAVTVVLGLTANVFIGKLSKKVHDSIAPQPETEDQED